MIIKAKVSRAGGKIINREYYWWTNWYIDQMMIGFPMCAIPDYNAESILEETFDFFSGNLLPIPREIWN